MPSLLRTVLQYTQRKPRHVRILYLTLAITIIVSLVGLNGRSKSLSHQLAQPIVSEQQQQQQPAAAEDDGFDWITQLINSHNPHLAAKLDKYQKGEPAKQFFSQDKIDFKFSKSYLEDDLLVVSDDSLHNLTASHESFIAELEQLSSDGTNGWFGNKHIKPQGRGIVFVGGGKFSWLSLITIEQLRHTNSQLHIEVFIATKEDYDPVFCEEILPKYHPRAKCTYFPRFFAGKEPQDVFTNEVTGYQYKTLALLVSSFEDVLLLDADNAPVQDPGHIFEDKVYKDTHLIIWPDPWARTTNPKFYQIANKPITNRIVRGYDFGRDENNSKERDFDYATNATFHDLEGTIPNLTAESGMMFVSKTKHYKTLLLALYYNVYGPGVYYSLLTQGGAGEGDKETFLAAAFVLNAPYHQIQTRLNFIGIKKAKDSEQEAKEEGQEQEKKQDEEEEEQQEDVSSKALGQKDPIQDYVNYLKGFRFMGHNNPKGLPKPKVAFMHLSYPKYTPQLLMDNNEFSYFDDNDGGKEIQRRLYDGATKRFGYDFELRMMRILQALMCTAEEQQEQQEQEVKDMVMTPDVAWKFKFFKGVDLEGYCERLDRHVNWLVEHPEKI